MRLKLLGALLFLLSAVQAQDIYVVNSINEIKVINIQSLVVTDLVSVDPQQVGYITDLAFAPDGRLFAVTNGWQVYQIDQATGAATLIVDLPIADPYTALVCNADNQLLTSRTFSEELYSYDIDNGSLNLVENGISSPGDFTFYKGNLIYPNILNDFVKAYDGTDIVNIGCSIPFLYTFVNDFVDCETNTIYAFDQFSNLYLFDVETENYELIAGFLNETGLLNGGATQTEWMASDCPVEILETVQCLPLGTNDFKYSGISLKANPVQDYIEFEIAKPMPLNYALYSTDGKLLNQGYLEGDSIPVSKISSGLYIVRLTDRNGQVLFQKLIIKP